METLSNVIFFKKKKNKENDRPQTQLSLCFCNVFGPQSQKHWFGQKNLAEEDLPRPPSPWPFPSSPLSLSRTPVRIPFSSFPPLGRASSAPPPLSLGFCMEDTWSLRLAHPATLHHLCDIHGHQPIIPMESTKHARNTPTTPTCTLSSPT